jgi:hypothetical protein
MVAVYIPLGMLFVGLATVTDGMCTQLNEPVVQLSMRPIESFRVRTSCLDVPERDVCSRLLGVGGVAQSKRSKPHLLQAARAQSSAAQRLPEGLAVCRQVALAGGGDGNQHHRVLEQLLLQRRSEPLARERMRLTYKTDGVQLGHFCIEAQAFGDPAQLLGHVLCGARFGAVEHESAPRRQWSAGHGGGWWW